MKTLPFVASLFLCLITLSSTAPDCTAARPHATTGNESSAESTVPAGIEVPANQALALTLTGRGVQIYKCSAVADTADKFEWILKGPEADLFDADGHKVGRHFAGPTWELDNGGKVIGRLKEKADAPDGKSIPWLLLEVVQASGPVMSKMQSIQRIDTTGGKSPPGPAERNDLGQEKRIKYTAVYKFYATSLPQPTP